MSSSGQDAIVVSGRVVKPSRWKPRKAESVVLSSDSRRSGGHGLPASRHGHDAGSPAAAAGGEGMGMRRPIDDDSLEWLGVNDYLARGNLWIMIEKVLTENQAKALEAGQLVLASQGVDDVLHHIGRNDVAVLAREVGVSEFAFELDVDGPLNQLMAVGITRDFGQPHARLSIGFCVSTTVMQFLVPQVFLELPG